MKLWILIEWCLHGHLGGKTVDDETYIISLKGRDNLFTASSIINMSTEAMYFQHASWIFKEQTTATIKLRRFRKPKTPRIFAANGQSESPVTYMYTSALGTTGGTRKEKSLARKHVARRWTCKSSALGIGKPDRRCNFVKIRITALISPARKKFFCNDVWISTHCLVWEVYAAIRRRPRVSYMLKEKGDLNAPRRALVFPLIAYTHGLVFSSAAFRFLVSKYTRFGRRRKKIIKWGRVYKMVNRYRLAGRSRRFLREFISTRCKQVF